MKKSQNPPRRVILKSANNLIVMGTSSRGQSYAVPKNADSVTIKTDVSDLIGSEVVSQAIMSNSTTKIILNTSTKRNTSFLKQHGFTPEDIRLVKKLNKSTSKTKRA